MSPMDINRSWLARLETGGAVQGEALEELRQTLKARLMKTFRGRPKIDDQFLDDVVQESLIKILDRLDQFQGRSLFTTWATTIAVRLAFTELRRRRWKDVSLQQLLNDAPGGVGRLSDQSREPQLEMEQQALVKAMYGVIERELTEKQRTALLAELKGMPLEEIGRRLGSNRNAVYKLTHDARKRLRKHLEAAGFTAADLQAS